MTSGGTPSTHEVYVVTVYDLLHWRCRKCGHTELAGLITKAAIEREPCDE